VIGAVLQRSPMGAGSALQCDTIAVGNDGVGVRGVRMNGRSGYICAGCKLLPKTRKLATDIAQATDFIYVKVLNNLIEAQPPGGDSLLILLRVEMPRNRGLFILLD